MADNLRLSDRALARLALNLRLTLGAKVDLPTVARARSRERRLVGLPAVARAAIRRAKVGAEDWNRTSDTSIFSAVLYRLSYLGTHRTRSAEPSS
jgi:hypothetical protein